MGENTMDQSLGERTSDERINICRAGRFERLTENLYRLQVEASKPYEEPAKTIPPELLSEFTMGGKAIIQDYYLNDKPHPGIGSSVKGYSASLINRATEEVRGRKRAYYGETDDYLHDAMTKYPVRGDVTVVVGSMYPQYEAFCLNYGATPVVVEYNVRYTNHEDVYFFTPEQFERSGIIADSAVSISSYEHDGLGRYGDPINPNADLEAMAGLKTRVKKGGRLFLAVPIGRDTVCWNAHRIYGPARLPLLLGEWTVVDAFGPPEGLLSIESGTLKFNEPLWEQHFPPSKSGPQWVFVLEN